MTIVHSTAECDYCKRGFIEDETIACKKCYHDLELEAAGLRDEVKRLKDTITEKGGRIK